MATTPISLELDAATIDRLAERGRETGQSQSELAQRYIEEGLRMERHPGIVFRDGPTGRRAALVSGPDVREMVPELRGVDPSDTKEIEAIAAWMGMSATAVRASLGYYIEFRDELDAWVAMNDELAERHRAAWRAERGLPSE